MENDLSGLLNGGFNGLYGEVVTTDCYKLNMLNYEPDVIFDLGANVGVFTRFARSLFPNATIISVEPHPDNFENLLKYTPSENVVFINKAIGQGSSFRFENEINGAHESYVNINISSGGTLFPTTIDCIMIDELVSTYLKKGQKSFLKLDIEGNENVIWKHNESMECLKMIDNIAMELHFVSINWEEEDCENTKKVMELLKQTHNCEYDNPIFYAEKK